MAEKSGIDPRYAAQFQRGYDPAQHPERQTERESERSRPVRLPGGPAPTAERVPASPPPVEPAAVDPVPEFAADADDLASLAGPRQRILTGALLAGGILLVALAAVTLWVSATDVVWYTSPTTPRDYAVLQARNSLPGPLLVAGVLAICGWLVIHAVRPRRAP